MGLDTFLYSIRCLGFTRIFFNWNICFNPSCGNQVHWSRNFRKDFSHVPDDLCLFPLSFFLNSLEVFLYWSFCLWWDRRMMYCPILISLMYSNIWQTAIRLFYTPSLHLYFSRVSTRSQYICTICLSAFSVGLDYSEDPRNNFLLASDGNKILLDLTCNLSFLSTPALVGNTDLKSAVAFWFLALIHLVDLCCGSTSPGNLFPFVLKLLTVMSCMCFWQGLDGSGLITTEDVGCHAFSKELDFAVFIFKKKSVISDMWTFSARTLPLGVW